MSTRVRWRAAAGMAALAVVATVAYRAGAAGGGPLVSTIAGKSVTAVKLVRHNAPPPIGTSSTSYVRVRGASTSIVVPAGTHAIVTATFNADAECDGSGTAGFCDLRITLNGDKGLPTGELGLDEAFMSTESNGTPALERYGTMERSWGPLGPGTYTVRALHKVTDSSVYFGIYAYTLQVERITTG